MKLWILDGQGGRGARSGKGSGGGKRAQELEAVVERLQRETMALQSVNEEVSALQETYEGERSRRNPSQEARSDAQLVRATPLHTAAHAGAGEGAPLRRGEGGHSSAYTLARSSHSTTRAPRPARPPPPAASPLTARRPPLAHADAG